MKRLFSLYINKVYTGSVFSIVLCLPLFLLTSCGVHELPEDGGVDPTVVHTTIVLLPGADMTPFDIPEFSTRAADGHTYEVRYQVEVYADDKYDQNLQFRRTLTYPEGYTGGSRFGMRPPCPQLSCGGMARLCTCRHFR